MWLEKVREAFSTLDQRGWKDASIGHYIRRIELILDRDHLDSIKKLLQIHEELINMRHNIYITSPKTGELSPIGAVFLQTLGAVTELLSKENIPVPAWADNVIHFPILQQVAA
jgi:hypothetical protein